jgi:DNA-binding HxlR family transcriptional regulator
MSRRRPDTVYPFNPDRCPLTATLRVIGGKWKGVIWWRLSAGIGRFGELQRAIPQITRKMLTQQLREMQRDGIVKRTEFDEKPLRVVYELTDYGRSLEPVIAAICTWGGGHLERGKSGRT